MHAHEVHTDVDLVRRLLRAQFPDWATRPLVPLPNSGTDNAIYRLGDDLAVRLPRIAEAEQQVEKERRWLPRLVDHLPLRAPAPLAVGVPGEGYPFSWSVQPWFEGRSVTLERLADPVQAAESLAGFTHALQAFDTTGGPLPCPPGSDRGAPLATRDRRVRACVDQLGNRVDRKAVLAAWEESLAAPPHDGPPVWIHGDLSPGNLIEQDGVIHAVIDFGCLAVGDPACDLIVCWNLFRGESRSAFRRAARPDDAAWARGRGWALTIALIALPYYLDTNPAIVEMSWRVVDEVLADRT